MPRPFVHIDANYEWRNKHENVQRRVARLYTVANRWADGTQPAQHAFEAGLLGLQQVINEAQAAGRQLRALGGSWSLSEVAATNDFLVDTKSLNTIQAGLPEAYCADPAKAQHDRLVFVQCGASILEINQKLEAKGLSLGTSGASNGQTFAGALATGTHGSANQVGSIQEMVMGLHVLRENGEAVWIERAARPIASQAFLTLLGGPAVIRDDQIFRAALVGVGTFGLVHGVVFEAEPLYLLERYIRKCPLATVRPMLSTLDVAALDLPGGAQLPFHFEVVVNAYVDPSSPESARVRFMYKRPFAAQPAGPAGSGNVTAPGDDLLAAIGIIGDLAPAVIPPAVGKVIDLQLVPVEKSLATHGQTFSSTTIRGAGTSIEMGVALTDAAAALEVILGVARQFAFGGIIALRYVRGTDALLGFTRFRPTTCTIEIPATLSSRSSEAYDRIVAALAAARIVFTLHWGQSLPAEYDAARIKAAYGSDADSWVAARRSFLPSAAGRALFSSGVIERAGLGG